MSIWASGDSLTPSTLNQKLASAVSSGGFSTNTLRAESGNTINSTSYVSAYLVDRGGGVVNVKSFGAVGDNSTDDTAAFNAAISALSATGGTLILPVGRYKLTSTLTLSPPTEGLIIEGQGAGSTVIYSSVTLTPAIVLGAAQATTRNQQFKGITLYRSDTSGFAPSKSTGNYGISAPAGLGNSTLLEDLDIRGFGDSAVYVVGPTGPVDIRAVAAKACAGYGIEMKVTGGGGAGNVSVFGGGVYGCWGGIYWDGSTGQGLNLYAPDIEVNTQARYPAVLLYSAQNGCGIFGGSYSIGVTGGSNFSVNPHGVIVLDSCRGVVVHGPQVIAGNGANCLQLMNGSQNVIIGGSYSNTSQGGYGASILSAALQSQFINTYFVPTAFASGRDVVLDAASVNNRTLVMGARLGSDATERFYPGIPTKGADGSATDPGYGFASEQSLGFYRSAASIAALSYGFFSAPGLISSTTTAASGATAKLPNQGQLYFSVLSLTSNGGEFGFRSGNTVYRFASVAVG